MTSDQQLRRTARNARIVAEVSCGKPNAAGVRKSSGETRGVFSLKHWTHSAESMETMATVQAQVVLMGATCVACLAPASASLISSRMVKNLHPSS